jgi:hypothetical protein
MVETTTP